MGSLVSYRVCDGKLPQPGHSGGMLVATDEMYSPNEEIALPNLIFHVL